MVMQNISDLVMPPKLLANVASPICVQPVLTAAATNVLAQVKVRDGPAVLATLRDTVFLNVTTQVPSKCVQ